MHIILLIIVFMALVFFGTMAQDAAENPLGCIIGVILALMFWGWVINSFFGG